jgi:hypothetical protein
MFMVGKHLLPEIRTTIDSIFLFSSVVTITEERKRLSLGFSEVHTSHVQPITGTPWEVPVPKNFNFILF